ncbi:hypothetical protein F2P81_017654 [Scophthalmus maximus]|uniref:KASH domain-containing protein n=1 Tax=Scophthalmus maximus TaxID=52904 RepID=A0A6A4S9K1_SCOMX|nr:hypothetical protein F2P81_017654 [Scophthalmus maximus]
MVCFRCACVVQVEDQQLIDSRSVVSSQPIDPIDHRSEIRDHRSEIRDHRSQITDQRSQITDQRSQITDQRGGGVFWNHDGTRTHDLLNSSSGVQMEVRHASRSVTKRRVAALPRVGGDALTMEVEYGELGRVPFQNPLHSLCTCVLEQHSEDANQDSSEETFLQQERVAAGEQLQQVEDKSADRSSPEVSESVFPPIFRTFLFLFFFTQTPSLPADELIDRRITQESIRSLHLHSSVSCEGKYSEDRSDADVMSGCLESDRHGDVIPTAERGDNSPAEEEWDAESSGRSRDGDVGASGWLERKWILWHEFMKEHAHLDAWLRLAEQAVSNPNPAHVTYTAAKEELSTFEVFEDDWILSPATDSGCPSESLLEDEGALDKPHPDLPVVSDHLQALALLACLIWVVQESPCRRGSVLPRSFHLMLRYVNGPPPT